MVTLAAMIDRVDQEVGRLVDNLKEHDELENTLIILFLITAPALMIAGLPYSTSSPRMVILPWPIPLRGLGLAMHPFVFTSKINLRADKLSGHCPLAGWPEDRAWCDR